jgi:hypothetical protein
MSDNQSLNLATMMADATAMAGGLTDFGDPSFRPALNQLCAALEAEAKLSDMGRGFMRHKLVTQLANRLRVEDWFTRHPEIEQEAIDAPVVIVGVPRTGTTKLHRLLSRDKRFHWMAFWESQFPVPLDGESLTDPAPRIRAGQELVDMMTTAMPGIMAIHPMATEEADEEVMLTEHAFMSAFNAYADIPSYMQWLDAQDQTPVYAYLKRMMKFLQWQKRQRGITAERWVLKAPHHLLRMEILLKMFPGAQIIHTHRDPTQSVPSMASFAHTLWGIYSDRADPLSAGREWNDVLRRAMAHTMQVRLGAPDQFIDVQFVDTVQRPMDVVHRLYAFMGLTLNAATEQRMRDWLVDDEKSHQGGHHYSAEQFGLSDAQIRSDFAAYIKKHCDR